MVGSSTHALTFSTACGPDDSGETKKVQKSKEMIVSGKEPSPIRRTNEHLFSEGNGDALVVVHGGPGMDFSYMKSSILTLSDSFRVILYEQRPLKSETLEKDFGAEDQVQDLVGLIGELSAESGDPVSLIAHSWGTYLALEALNSADSKSIGKVVLVNPLPLTWGRLVEAGGRLGGRVKPEHLEIVDRLERTGTEEAGFELMELVSYAYLAPANRGIVKPDVRRYNPLVNAQVTESVVYRFSASKLYPVISSYADPALDRITHSPYYSAVVDHLKPTCASSQTPLLAKSGSLDALPCMQC